MKYLELIQGRDSRGHEKRFRVGSEWKTVGNLLDIPADGLNWQHWQHGRVRG